MSRVTRSRRWQVGILGALTALVLTGLTGSTFAAPPQRQASLEEHLKHLESLGRDVIREKPREIRTAITFGGIRDLRALGKLADSAAAAGAALPGRAQLAPTVLAAGQASDPFQPSDLTSRLAGMTQSETSAAWCGDNAVIGFNDSGSFIATAFLNRSASGSLSFNGWSRSSNGGASYADQGALTADPLPADVMFRDLFGDPVLGCTSSADFYYVSLAIDTGFGFATSDSGISVSRSHDGGNTFGRAVMAASKDLAAGHFLDKPWLAVSPGPSSAAGDDILHVTYTDFDETGTSPCGVDVTRTAIEYVRSTDGGATWSAPSVIEETCGGTFVQGSQVEVGVDDEVYVAWEHYGSFETGRDIRLRRSGNGGSSFGPSRMVSAVVPVGDGFLLQGAFRAFIDLQGLAVDRSNGPNRGTVHISWHDGRNRSKPDPFGFCDARPRYCFGDILTTRSSNDGMSWSTPLRVNDDAIDLGADQFMPAIDIDSDGTVWVAYHDRRRDARNLLIDTFLARSDDGGSSFSEERLTSRSFPAITGSQDLLVNPRYMGDYITVAHDATGGRSGVIVAWGDNSRGDANVLQDRR